MRPSNFESRHAEQRSSSAARCFLRRDAIARRFAHGTRVRMLQPLASLRRHFARVTFYESYALSRLSPPSGGGHSVSQATVQRRRFSSHEDAFEFLRAWLGDPAARAELMRVLQRSGSSMASQYGGQDGWAHALAARLASGEIAVMEERYQTDMPGRLVAPASVHPAAVDLTALPLLSEIGPAATVAPPPSPRPAPVATPAAVTSTQAVADEIASFPEMGLQIAQAVALELAAAGAIPFCEICAQARAEQQAAEQAAKQAAQQAAALAPVEAAPENTQQLAQAKTFEEAAKTGAPFCEICEQQRLAREKEKDG